MRVSLDGGGSLLRRLGSGPVTFVPIYTIDFAERQEAAVFVAALSAALLTPIPGEEGLVLGPLSVMARARVGRQGVTVYMSYAAIHIARAAIAPLPATDVIDADEVPSDSLSILDSLDLRARSVDEVHRRLTSA